MPDTFDQFLAARAPVAGRPLLGLTILAVEDSRFASEAVRLLCLRSGARLRRADTLRAARRHLATYRPSVVIIDMGLPDGSGADLIAELAQAEPRIPAVLAISGDPDAEAAAMAAGADGFFAKPLESLTAFQDRIAAVLGTGSRTAGAGTDEDAITPDPLALRDDLAHAARVLEDAGDAPTLGYLAGFLSGVARSSGDAPLARAAARLAADPAHRAATSGLVQARLAAGVTL